MVLKAVLTTGLMSYIYIPAFRWLRLGNCCCGSKANLLYIVSSRAAWDHKVRPLLKTHRPKPKTYTNFILSIWLRASTKHMRIKNIVHQCCLLVYLV